MAQKPKQSAELETTLVPVERIAQQIYLIRGQKVMLDSDLAALYQVPTKVFNQAVKRNLDRFPDDFMFRLTEGEARVLRSQIVTLEKGRGRYFKYAPYAFTELGVAMLASVLNSDRAVRMNIIIMRTFVKLREILASNKDLAARLEKVESAQAKHASVITILAEEIDNLKQLPPEPPRRRIGFLADDAVEGE